MLLDEPCGEALCNRLGCLESSLCVFAGGGADLIVHRPGAHASVGLKLADIAFPQAYGVLQRLDGEIVMSAGSETIAAGSQRGSRSGQAGRKGMLQSPVVGQHGRCVGYLTRDERQEQRYGRPVRLLRDDFVAVQGGPFAQCHLRFPPT